MSLELADQVMSLIRAICRFHGRTATPVKTLTIDFIRWVLNLFFSSLGAARQRCAVFAELERVVAYPIQDSQDEWFVIP